MNPNRKEVIIVDDKRTITKEEFEAYEDVRQSGVTNMFDVRRVQDLSGLDRETIMAIMNQYSELADMYL